VLLFAVMLGLGNGMTETVTIAEFVQVFKVEITVYLICCGGLEVTCAPVVAFKKLGGCQLYKVPVPAAIKSTDEPKQTKVGLGLMFTIGKGLTVILLVCKAELQPKLPPNTENTELILGLATDTLPVV
jgi:hypothetical protein